MSDRPDEELPGAALDEDLVEALRGVGAAIVRLADISVTHDQTLREEFEPVLRGVHKEVVAGFTDLQRQFNDLNKILRDNSRATRENTAKVEHFSSLVEALLAREKARGDKIGKEIADLEGKILVVSSQVAALRRHVGYDDGSNGGGLPGVGRSVG
jgi:hypothetical protein